MKPNTPIYHQAQDIVATALRNGFKAMLVEVRPNDYILEINTREEQS